MSHAPLPDELAQRRRILSSSSAFSAPSAVHPCSKVADPGFIRAHLDIDCCMPDAESMTNESPPTTPHVLFDGRFLQAVRVGHWEYVRRKNTSGIVILVAITPSNELILVEQHRIPVDAPVIELPAGLAGDIAGSELEPLEEAAARELEEETGWRAQRLVRLAAGPVSAGLTSEVVTFFGAYDLERVGEGGGDASEDIRVHHVPLDEVPSWLIAQEARGALVDPKVFSALHFASLTHHEQRG